MGDFGRFTAKMALKREEELRAIANDSNYVEEARLAAIEELKKREILGFEEAEVSIHKEVEKKEERAKERQRVWESLPTEMKWVIRALWSSAALVALLILLLGVYGVELNGVIIQFSGGLMILFLLFVFGIPALFILGFERKKDWVRWLYIVLIGISTLSTLLNLITEEIQAIDVFPLTARVLEAFAAFLLLRPQANEWFTKDQVKSKEVDLLDNHESQSFDF
jgi:hypothetical protein